MIKCKNQIVGEYDGQTYIRLAGVDFYPEELLAQITEGKIILLTHLGVYYISDAYVDGYHRFKATLLDSGAYASPHRFFLQKLSVVGQPIRELVENHLHTKMEEEDIAI